MRTRDEPTYPLVGLAVIVIVCGGFWTGVILLAEKVFQ
jgi:hypothetical protein